MFFAQPLWVNLLLFIPFLILIILLKTKVTLPFKKFIWGAIFGLAMAYLEAVGVVYLRIIFMFILSFQGINFDPTIIATNYDILNLFGNIQTIIQGVVLNQQWLIIAELIREAATLIVLGTVAVLIAKKLLPALLAFFWVFAWWDLFYYVFLYLLIRWPTSLMTKDLLFLIPTPWVSAVWLPIFISSATILIIAGYLAINLGKKHVKFSQTK